MLGPCVYLTMFVTDVAMLNTRRHVSFFSLRFTTRPTLLSKGGFGVHTALSRGMAQTLPLSDYRCTFIICDTRKLGVPAASRSLLNLAASNTSNTAEFW